MNFAQNAEGKWGYIPSGADTVIPFKSGSGSFDLIHTITSPYPNYLKNTYTFEKDYTCVMIVILEAYGNIKSKTTFNGQIISDDLWLRTTTPSLNQGGCGTFTSLFIPNVKSGDVFYVESAGFSGSFYDIYGTE